MIDYPIIFSRSMIAALLEGSKTQTRIALYPVPKDNNTYAFPIYDKGKHIGRSLYGEGVPPKVINQKFAVGDRLWVREAWRSLSQYDSLKPSELPKSCPIYYDQYKNGSNSFEFTKVGCRAPITMPRWASRITLDITNIHIERLQDISDVDAIAEGARKDALTGRWTHSTDITFRGDWFNSPKKSYKTFWNSIHRPNAWDSNPWVVVTSFEVWHGNIDM